MSTRRPFFLLIVIPLVACRAPEQPAPAQAAVIQEPPVRTSAQQCTYVTDQEASQVLGRETLAQPADSGCYFQSVKGDTQGIILEVVRDTSPFYQATTQPDAEMVGDIGDRAVWLSSARVLHVVDGSRMLTVKMGTEKTKYSDLIAKAKGLARIAITRR